MKLPKLRFSEFIGDWETVKLNQIVERVTRKNTNLESLLPLTISAQQGLVEQDTFFNKKVASKNLENYYLLNIGEFAYNKSYSNGYPFGTVKRLDKYQKGVLSSLYICFRAKEALSDFLVQYFESVYWHKEISMIAVEGARNHGLLNISVNDFFITYHNIPTVPEQEKISSFLSKVDEKIKKLEEKQHLWETYKKGIMQQIFSNDLRFKDENGDYYPDWEEKELAEVSESLDNLRKPLNSDERKKIRGNIPYYGANGVVDYVDGYLYNEPLVLLAEDGGNFEEFQNRPIAQLITGKSWVNNHAHVLRNSSNITIGFLFYSLVHKDIRKFINGTSRSKLNKKDMLSIRIQLPIMAEQEKISSFLSILDKKIDLIKKEVKINKEFDKGLLQEMFC